MPLRMAQMPMHALSRSDQSDRGDRGRQHASRDPRRLRRGPLRALASGRPDNPDAVRVGGGPGAAAVFPLYDEGIAAGVLP